MDEDLLRLVGAIENMYETGEEAAKRQRAEDRQRLREHPPKDSNLD